MKKMLLETLQDERLIALLKKRYPKLGKIIDQVANKVTSKHLTWIIRETEKIRLKGRDPIGYINNFIDMSKDFDQLDDSGKLETYVRHGMMPSEQTSLEYWISQPIEEFERFLDSLTKAHLEETK
ncbi:MAG: hypothetical protein H7831_15250 [Magnetococcus sp. WYHC-3]